MFFPRAKPIVFRDKLPYEAYINPTTPAHCLVSVLHPNRVQRGRVGVAPFLRRKMRTPPYKYT